MLSPLNRQKSPRKAILTLYICEMLVRGLGWNSELGRKQLGLASIIHDCFLKSEQAINISSLNSLAYKQASLDSVQEEFKNHPIRSAELTDQFSGFSNVEFIILEHHEHPSGKGFPYGKNSS